MNLIEFERGNSFFLSSIEWGDNRIENIIAVLKSCRNCLKMLTQLFGDRISLLQLYRSIFFLSNCFSSVFRQTGRLDQKA